MRDDRGAEGIRYLLAEYCHTIDDGRDAEWADLFHSDAVFTLDGLGELSGRDSVRTFVNGALDSLAAHGIAGINHLTYNSTIAIDGERATTTSDLAVMVPAQGAFTAISLGRYHDVLVLEDRWRFRERRISWFKNDLPAAFAAALAPIFTEKPA